MSYKHFQMNSEYIWYTIFCGIDLLTIEVVPMDFVFVRVVCPVDNRFRVVNVLSQPVIVFSRLDCRHFRNALEILQLGPVVEGQASMDLVHLVFGPEGPPEPERPGLGEPEEGSPVPSDHGNAQPVQKIA